MSTWRQDPAIAAIDLVKELREYIAELPADVEAAVSALDAIKDPVANPHDHVAELIAACASEKDISAALLADVIHDRRRNAAVVARQINGRRLLSAIRKAAPAIHEQLRPIAEELIEKVLDAGRNGTVPIETFIREKRVRDAELRAELPENDARLRQLYSLRNRIWNVKQTASAEGIDCSEFSEPLSMTAAPGVQLSRETTPAAKWHSIVNRGGESMWYPTRPQFEAKAETYAQAARERANKQQQQWLAQNRRLDFAGA
jgi:hypothetical protein